MTLKLISNEQALAVLRPAEAVHALRTALKDGFDPSTDPLRTSMEVTHGNFLVMPSTSRTSFGVKLISMAGEGVPDGTPFIQGSYVLFDGTTLAPKAVIDGVALTNLRTPAVSISCVYQLLSQDATPLKVVIFGTGAQGRAHQDTIEDTFGEKRPVEITFIGRNKPKDGLEWAKSGSEKAHNAIAAAELIICATTSSNPILHAADIRNDAVVVALGSHTPSARELSGDLMQAAQVIIEDKTPAFNEAGDIIQAMEEGNLKEGDLFTYAQVVRGEAQLDRTRPVVFKFTGMSWEDLVVAEAISRNYPR